MAGPMRWSTTYGLRHLYRGQVYIVATATADAVLGAAAAANSHTARQVGALAEVFARGLAPNERQRMNQALGEMGQRSVLASYDQSVTARQNKLGNAFPYRRRAVGRNRRYAGGMLRSVLAAPSFFRATPDSLLFINEARLNKAAKQWARLNAGAGARAGSARRPMEVRWSNVVVGVLGVGMAPRPSYSMPRGYWFARSEGAVVSASAGRRGRDEFYPAGTGPFRGRTRVERRVKGGDPAGPGLMAGRGGKRPSKGFRGRQFLDAGTDRIADQYPKLLSQLYRNLWDAGVAGAAGSGAPVTGPRPRRLKGTSRPV